MLAPPIERDPDAAVLRSDEFENRTAERLEESSRPERLSDIFRRRGLGPLSRSGFYPAERLFPELDQSQLKRLAVTSVSELETTIDEYLEDRTRDPHPFVWTASAAAIIEKVQRGNETLATLH